MDHDDDSLKRCDVPSPRGPAGLTRGPGGGPRSDCRARESRPSAASLRPPPPRIKPASSAGDQAQVFEVPQLAAPLVQSRWQMTSVGVCDSVSTGAKRTSGSTDPRSARRPGHLLGVGCGSLTRPIWAAGSSCGDTPYLGGRTRSMLDTGGHR